MGEVADVPGKGKEPPNLTHDQDEKLRRLMRRSDTFNNARTALEDHATGKMHGEILRHTLAVLVEEGEWVNEEFNRDKEELGIGPILSK